MKTILPIILLSLVNACTKETGRKQSHLFYLPTGQKAVCEDFLFGNYDIELYHCQLHPTEYYAKIRCWHGVCSFKKTGE